MIAKKTPFVMQLEALECGAACLSMIMAYYGKWVPLEKVRSDCGVSRDGSNAANVVKAAKNYGLEASAYRMEPEDLENSGMFPCIVHWEFNHFIVVNGFTRKGVSVNDPGRGPIVMTRDQFDKGFTGVVLFFKPGEKFERGGSKRSIFEFASSRLKGTGPAVLFVLLTTIISALIGVMQPSFARMFLDKILGKASWFYARPFFRLLIIVGILQIVVGWIGAVYSLRFNGKLAVEGSTSFMWKILHLPMDFFSQRMAGDIMIRQNTNATISSVLVNTVAPLALDTIMMVFYLVIMARYSPALACVGVVTVIINVFTSTYISKKRINVSRIQMRDEGKLYSATVSGVAMVETLKATGSEDGFFKRWAGYQANSNLMKVKFAKIEAYLGSLPAFFLDFANIIVVGLGIYFAMTGSFTLGMIVAFQSYLRAFLEPAASLTAAGQTVMEMRTQMERVVDVLEYPDDSIFDASKNEDKEQSYEKLSGNVEIEHVTFGYSPLSKPLINDFSLSIKAGGRVAFVGNSGCGKSTIAKLISGINKPWEGSISFDGCPITDIDRNVFTGSVAVVDQDIILFEDTISNNIKMWDESIEDFEVIMAARDAQIHDDIMAREGGYSRKLAENGADLSGGQRQRLEIARVLAQDPTIIILDEATSALDAKTEYEVVNAIKDRGITCIVVAHRLSTIRDCDEIIVLDNGTVVERGTHDELMALGGYYTNLVADE